MSLRRIFGGLDFPAQCYIILFAAIMFSGATPLRAHVMPMICVLWLLLFAMAYARGSRRRATIRIKEEGIKLVSLLIVLFLACQMLTAYYPATTKVFLERFFVYGLFFWVVPSLGLNRRVIDAIRFYSYPAALSIVGMTLYRGEKSGGLLGDYQSAGMLMSICFGVILIHYYYEEDQWDIPGLVFTFLALMMSGKRSFSVLAVLAFFLIYLLNHEAGKKRRFVKLILAAVPAAVLAFAAVPAVRLVVERIIEFQGDKTFNGRLYYWIAARSAFANHRLTGIGMGGFSQYFDQYFHRLGNLEAYDAHNVYIQMAAELGVIGEGLFLLLFLLALVKSVQLMRMNAVKQDRDCRYILSYSILIQVWFLLYCLTGNPLYGSAQYFFYGSAVQMMLSVSAVYGKHQRKKQALVKAHTLSGQ